MEKICKNCVCFVAEKDTELGSCKVKLFFGKDPACKEFSTETRTMTV